VATGEQVVPLQELGEGKRGATPLESAAAARRKRSDLDRLLVRKHARTKRARVGMNA
jgi:hypothetical protein